MAAFDPDVDLQGTVAVVTGAFSGIGLALARRAARRGCRGVALLDVEAGAGAEAARSVAAVPGAVADILCVHCDVSSEASVRESLATVQARWPKAPIGLLCCNAGVMSSTGPAARVFGNIIDSTMKDWAFIMGVNVFGVVHTLRTYVPILAAQTGRRSCVICTASMTGLMWTILGPYSVSKHACASVTEGLYHDLLAKGVTNVSVHCLCPAIIATKIFHAERNRPEELRDSSGHSSDGGGGGGRVRDAEKLASAMRRATQELFAEEGLSAEATAESAFEQVRAGYFWLLVDNPPPVQLDIKAKVGRRMSSILTQWPPPQPPEGVRPSYIEREVARRTQAILSKL